MNMPTKKALNLLIISTLACVSLTSVTGCDMFEKKDTAADKYKVKLPSTPPLKAGSSVSQSSSGIASTSQMEQQKVVLEKINQAVVTPANVKLVSIVTNKVTPGTPEATLKTSLDIVYSGDTKDAIQYYHIEGVPDFGKELQAAQKDIQKSFESITFKKTTFNESKTEAKIDFDIKFKGKKEVNRRISSLQKINGKWKIIG